MKYAKMLTLNEYKIAILSTQSFQKYLLRIGSKVKLQNKKNILVSPNLRPYKFKTQFWGFVNCIFQVM